MKNVTTDRRNVLLIENIFHLKTVRHSGKYRDDVSFIRSQLRQRHHKTDDNRIRMKMRQKYAHQVVLWSLL
jgi:hypothetical protein